MMEDTLLSIERQEKNLQDRLAELEEVRSALNRLEEEVMESAGETMYHLSQILAADLTAYDALAANDIIGSVRRYTRDIDAYFEERKELMRAQEDATIDELEVIRRQKSMEINRLEEAQIKERLDGQY